MSKDKIIRPGQYRPNIDTIWEVKQIKVGSFDIKLVADSNVPRDEIWFVDEDSYIKRFKVIPTP